ncbi:MAG: class II histone deacetylase [Gammaproteobacteria bacterium]|nr:class II histone deacetylase [Gammaproteobacteria bacterium]MDP7454960.1 class II histone deacetylase [Gammaproteobacteria bacterium]HJO11639.1 class II histone deacetylase [Gammaproteobacteria bacterium]
MSNTGFVWHEKYMWHDTGAALGVLPVNGEFQPWVHFENPETKRRLKNLLDAYKVTDTLVPIAPTPASEEQLLRVHTAEYVDRIETLSANQGGNAGELTPFGPGSYEIALLAAGGCIAASTKVLNGEVRNAYALVRPCGHHAEADRGRGFCIFSNIAITVRDILTRGNISRVAVVDWDVHHGNGTEAAFYEDPDILTISLHEDSLYPYNSGSLQDCGKGAGHGRNINIPLPPGSGGGAYNAAMERVVLPALELFQPEIILVASGLDGSTWDPLGHMMMLSSHYKAMTEQLIAVADKLCQGRLVVCHEGGYSAGYVPFCGAAIIEALTGQDSGITDPFAKYESTWQTLQSNQEAVLKEVERVALSALRDGINR